MSSSSEMTVEGEAIAAETSSKKAYVAPKLTELGSLHGSTMHAKVGPRCDISCFHNASVSHH